MRLPSFFRLPLALRIALIWAGVATFFVLQNISGALVRGRPVDPLFHIANEYGYWTVWALLTPALLAVITRYPFDKYPKRDVLVHIAAMTVLGLVQVAGADAIEFALVALLRPVPAEQHDRWIRSMETGVPALWFTFVYKYWAVVGIVLAAQYYRRWQEREIASAQLAAGLAQARLATLRAQLQPHFLFNALHTVGMLSVTEPREATRVVTRLSELLRRTIDLPDDHPSRLDQELDFTDRYLEIERARFTDRLKVELTAPDEVLQARVPALVLQPLVENSVRHGIGARVDGGTIRVNARKDGQRLILEVSDDGPGFPGNWESSTGVGLRNLRERLERLYGERATMELPRPGAQGSARITLPLVMA